MSTFDPIANPVYRRYAAVRRLIKQADFLLWRSSRTAFGRLILRRAPPELPYTHFGMAILSGYKGGPIHSVDTECFLGGQRRRLSQDVLAFPGTIDVWRIAKNHWDADAVAAEMETIVDRPYGLWAGLAYFLRTAKWWPFMQPLADERLNGRIKPVCSQAGAVACRVSGRDPLPPGETFTCPWHFAQNGFSEYRFTLTP